VKKNRERRRGVYARQQEEKRGRVSGEYKDTCPEPKEEWKRKARKTGTSMRKSRKSLKRISRQTRGLGKGMRGCCRGEEKSPYQKRGKQG